jgi:hypothetical protein
VQRDILNKEIENLFSKKENGIVSYEIQPSNINVYNTDLNAPYYGGNFDFSYDGGLNEATVTFSTYFSYRKNFSNAEKRLFENNLLQAIDVWDNAAELQLKDVNGNYNTKIKIRFKLRLVKNTKYANKKTDVHPNGTWSSWFNGKDREIVMRNLNVFIGSSRNVLVHELGHVWGLMDEYDTKWIEMKFSPAHVGKGSPLLKDEKAIMNLGYQDEIFNSGEFRTRYFTHFGRKILGAFWGLKDYMLPIKVKSNIVSTVIIGRINLLKKDIQGSPPNAANVSTLNPGFTNIQIAKRGKVSERNKEFGNNQENNSFV